MIPLYDVILISINLFWNELQRFLPKEVYFGEENRSF